LKTSESGKNEIKPRHLGLILDGNRRWAKKHNLPSVEGHRRGLYDALIPILKACSDRGIDILTIYCFSTENWNRSKEELAYLMKLFEIIFKDKLKEVTKDGIRINVIGRLEDFPVKIQELAQKAMENTKDNKKGVLNIAMSYGGRAEIVDATRQIIKDGLSPEEINEEKFAEYIYEEGQPDPDLIIRTGGELRLSNFMMWQSAYSELYFTDTYLPDFTEKDLDAALEDFASRKRRYGK
jgi:undecaprenyl diphosphate synthase